MWDLAVEVARSLGREGAWERVGKADGLGKGADILTALLGTADSSPSSISIYTYGDIKATELLAARRRVKEDARRLALKGWVRNLGDEDFVL
jgi:tRNA-specific adenosine deaminase 1